MGDQDAAVAVSVIIPVYNRMVYLGAALESVLAQSFQHWEMVVVDDGSEEDVCGFVARYADPRISFVRQQNQGNAAARNAGAALASGRYLAFLDSDDVWHPEMLESCADELAARPEVGVVHALWEQIDAEGSPLGRPVDPWPGRGGDLLEKLILGLPILPSSAVIRRTWFDRVGGFDVNLDDWDLWLRLALAGCPFVLLERYLVSYRIHETSLHREYEARRPVHLGTLDKLFSSPDLPDTLRGLRERAYSSQYRLLCIKAFHAHDIPTALEGFVQAVALDPALLTDLGFYYEIACDADLSEKEGRAKREILDRGQRHVEAALLHCFSRPDLRPTVRALRGRARGIAHLALGMAYYAHAEDCGAARRHLWRAARADSRLLLTKRWYGYMARSLLGGRIVGWARQIRNWLLVRMSEGRG